MPFSHIQLYLNTCKHVNSCESFEFCACKEHPETLSVSVFFSLFWSLETWLTRRRWRRRWNKRSLTSGGWTSSLTAPGSWPWGASRPQTWLSTTRSWTSTSGRKHQNVTETDFWSFQLNCPITFALYSRSVYHLTQLCVPHLIKTKGSIVNVSSINGQRSVRHMFQTTCLCLC